MDESVVEMLLSDELLDKIARYVQRLLDGGHALSTMARWSDRFDFLTKQIDVKLNGALFDKEGVALRDKFGHIMANPKKQKGCGFPAIANVVVYLATNVEPFRTELARGTEYDQDELKALMLEAGSE